MRSLNAMNPILDCERQIVVMRVAMRMRMRMPLALLAADRILAAGALVPVCRLTQRMRVNVRWRRKSPRDKSRRKKQAKYRSDCHGRHLERTGRNRQAHYTKTSRSDRTVPAEKIRWKKVPEKP
jgi:hypothetical protein